MKVADIETIRHKNWLLNLDSYLKSTLYGKNQFKTSSMAGRLISDTIAM